MNKKVCSLILPCLLVVALFSGCTAAIKKARHSKRGDEYFKAGDYEKAKIEYTNLLRVDSKDATAFERIGIMWLEEGAPLRAGPFMLRAKELAPDRVAIRTKLGEIYSAVGGSSEATKEALEALKMEPGNEQALLILTDAARTPEEIQQADEELKHATHTDTVSYHLALATNAMHKNDPATLEAELQKAIAADPKSSQAHLALARFRLATKRSDEARGEFKKAIENAPARSTAHLMWAEFLALNNETDQASAYLDGILKQVPDFLPAWALQAKYTAKKNFDQALALLENIFRRDPQHFDARMLESEFYLSKGDPKKAIESLRQTETSYPKIPVVKYQLGRAYIAAGDTVQAAGALEAAIALVPNYDDAVLLLAEVNLRSGNPGPVIGAMEAMLKLTPNVERAQVMLADAYRATGRFDDAAEIIRKQIAAAPQKPEPYLLLGMLLRQQNKVEEARAMMEKAVELSPEKLSALNQLTELDIISGNAEGALKRVNSYLEKSPDAPGLYMLQGKLYAALRDWPKAETALRKVMELNADIPAAYELLVSVCVAANKLPQAISELETYLAKSPNSPGALMTLALLYSQTQSFDKARDAYEKLLTVRPDYSPALNNLAYIYSEKILNLDRAAELARKAHSLQPGDGAMSDTLGWILYKQGDYQAAVDMLQEAVGKLADVPDVQFHFGMANYMMGRSEAARSALQKAVNAKNDFADKPEALKRLDLLAKGVVGAPDSPVAKDGGPAKEQATDDVISLVRSGEAYEKQGDFPKAKDTFEQALKANPKLVTPTLKLAQLNAGPLNNKVKALEYGKKARELAPADPEVARTLGRIASQTGNWSWGYGLLQESARRLSDNASVQHDFAWAAYGVGKIPEARRAMERVVSLSAESAEGKDAATFLNLVDDEGVAAGEAKAADANAILKDKPDFVPALAVAARARAKTGDAKGAEEFYNRILQTYPEFAPAQRDLAAIYSTDPANTARAYDLATKARKTLPEDNELSRVLGKISYQKKDYAQAAQALQQSARKTPLDAESLFYLGMSQLHTRQQTQGKQTLEQAIAAGLDGAQADEARNALQEEEAK